MVKVRSGRALGSFLGREPERALDVGSLEAQEDRGSDAESSAGRRVEIMLDDELYDRVRVKAMRQRKSLRALGAELFAAWAEDDASSSGP